MKGGGVIAVLAILALFQMAVRPGEVVTCGQVDAALVHCIDYHTRKGGDTPPPACCSGVEAVKGMAQTTDDKRACCSCVKAAANSYTDLKDAEAQSLPANCGVNMDIPISRSMDCDKI